MGADGGWEVDEVSNLDRVLLKTYGGETKEGKGGRKGTGSDSFGAGKHGAKSKVRVANPLASKAETRIPESISSTASTESEGAGEQKRIRETQAFERVRGIKRKRELEDIGAREKANDRDPRTGAWAPKPRRQDPIWIRKSLKCFPLYVRDFTGASLEIARLISRTR